MNTRAQKLRKASNSDLESMCHSTLLPFIYRPFEPIICCFGEYSSISLCKVPLSLLYGRDQGKGSHTSHGGDIFTRFYSRELNLYFCNGVSLFECTEDWRLGCDMQYRYWQSNACISSTYHGVIIKHPLMCQNSCGISNQRFYFDCEWGHILPYKRPSLRTLNNHTIDGNKSSYWKLLCKKRFVYVILQFQVIRHCVGTELAKLHLIFLFILVPCSHLTTI